jgi:membrane associated rhomboid family serine protease
MFPRVDGWWKPVEVKRDVPGYVDFVGGVQFRVQPPGAPPAALVQPPGKTSSEKSTLTRGTLLFQRDVWDVDANPPDHVGTITYQWMPPFQRWFHFSTLKGVRKLEVWRFIGFQFLHGSLMHLMFNMIALYFFGSIVERYLGGKRYLAFYLLCGIAGAMLYGILNLSGVVVSLLANGPVSVPGLLFDSTATPLVGASAGVFGVLMAGAYLVPNAIVLLFFIVPMRLATLAYAFVALAVVSVLLGSQNAGGEAGHLGGAIAGFYFIRHPDKLHGFFDFVGWADPTSHHYRDGRPGPKRKGSDHREIDGILDKINEGGLHSLTEKEKRVLREASEKRS